MTDDQRTGKYIDVPKPTAENTLIFGEDNPYYTFKFTHARVPELGEGARSFFAEAVDRFASLLVENIEKMDNYRVDAGDSLAGIKNTVKLLKKINRKEDMMSDGY